MADQSATKESILSRIRAANSARSIPAAANDYAALPRTYTRAGTWGFDERIQLFEQRVTEYEAGVTRTTKDSIAATVAKILTLRDKRRIAVPSGVPDAWLPEGFSFSHGDAASAQDLDCLDGLLSACTVAIATTGTIVLQNAPAQGPRRFSLVPDYHLCIVFASQIVETVPEAFDILAPTSTLPTTFISGPSATADIEMTRIKGVHGPRFLDVILVV
jgi:L-lactate dehydrogenase complex protein LldG